MQGLPALKLLCCGGAKNTNNIVVLGSLCDCWSRVPDIDLKVISGLG